MKQINIPHISSYVILTKDMPEMIHSHLSLYIKGTYSAEGWYDKKLPILRGDWFEISTIVLPKKYKGLSNDLSPCIWVKILRSKRDRKFIKTRIDNQMRHFEQEILTERATQGKIIDLRIRRNISYSLLFRGDEIKNLVWVDTKEEAIALRNKLINTDPDILESDLDRFNLV